MLLEVPQFFVIMKKYVSMFFSVYLSEKLRLSQNYVTSEGAVSHNVLYYQQLFIATDQTSCYANNYFE